MKYISSNPDDFNIYCTGADDPHYSFLSLPADALLSQIKTSSFLGKHIYISAGHIYDNPQTRILLERNIDLLLRGIVAIGLRSDCRDFSDLNELRQSQGKSQKKDLTKFLDHNTSTIIVWTPLNQQALFKKAIYESLLSSDSILRRRLIGTRKEGIESLAKEIEELPFEKVSRETLYKLAILHVPKRINVFMRDVNLIYYMIGARDKNLIPHLSPALFSDLKKGIVDTITPSLTTLSPEQSLKDVFNEMVLPKDILDKMTVPGLAEFREKNRKILEAFRRKWWAIIQNVPTSVQVTNSPMEMGNTIHTLLLEQAHKEIKRAYLYDRITKNIGIGISSFIIGNINRLGFDFEKISHLFSANIITALSVIIAAGAIAMKPDQVKRRIINAPFWAISNALTTEIKRNLK